MPGGVCSFSPLCTLVGAGGALSSSFFGTATNWVADSTSWVWSQLGGFLSSTSQPSVVTRAAAPEFANLVVVAPIVAAAGFAANVLGSLRRGDGWGMTRDVFVVVPLIVLAIGAAPAIATVVLDAVNALSSAAAASAGRAVATLANEANRYPAGTPGFAEMLMDLGAVVGTLVLWFELVVRNAVLALLLCLSPVVLAGAIWAPMRRVALRLFETFTAVALSKFVVVVALSLGASAISSSTGAVQITGAAVVALAVFAPFALLRVVPLLEYSTLHALEGMRQRATSGARRASALASSGAAMVAPMAEMRPPEMPDDLGLEDWPAGPEPVFPKDPDVPPVPPIGTPTLRRGHVAYLRDRYGPVIGWHFDD